MFPNVKSKEAQGNTLCKYAGILRMVKSTYHLRKHLELPVPEDHQGPQRGQLFEALGIRVKWSHYICL